MIKVLMCLYNGEKYLTEQLNSLLSQTKQPDEVIIYDDLSTDNSVELLKLFINEHNLDKWKLIVNSQNLGWRRNFYNAIVSGHSDDDIIFFCDQDDIWDTRKIEIMVGVIEQNKSILRLSSEQLTIDSNNNELSTWIRSVNTNTMEISRENYLDNLFTIGWQNRIGCAMAIRGKLANYIAENYEFNEYFAHDEICVNASDYLCGGYLIDYTSIRYRVHGGNASHNKTDYGSRKAKIKVLNEDISHLEYIKSGLSQKIDNVDSRIIDTIDNQIKLANLRIKYLTKRNILGILKNRKLYNESPSKIDYKGDIVDILGLRKLLKRH